MSPVWVLNSTLDLIPGTADTPYHHDPDAPKTLLTDDEYDAFYLDFCRVHNHTPIRRSSLPSTERQLLGEELYDDLYGTDS